MVGNYDLLSGIGLTYVPGSPSGNLLKADVIRQMIPWSNLAWIQVHHGQIPLWNPFNFVGSPLAFNWQSSAFSLPTVLGYLVPLKASFTVSVVAVVLFAGLGTYFCGRCIGVSRLSAVWMSICFSLSGTMVFWIGWSAAGVLGLMGWVVGSAIMAGRSSRSAWPWWTASLAFSLAASIYGGQIDVLGAELCVAGGSAAAVLCVHAIHRRDIREVLSLLGRVLPGLVFGVLLSTPLLLPGLQLANHAIRAASGFSTIRIWSAAPVSSSTLLHLFLPGIPTADVPLELQSFGALATMFAIVGVLTCWRRRIVQLSVQMIPLVSHIRFQRSLLVMVFFMAVLSGIGFNEVLKGGRRAQRIAGVVLGILVVLYLGTLIGSGRMSGFWLTAVQLRFRWTMLSFGLVVIWLVALRLTEARWRRHITMGMAVVAVVLEASFLVAAGSPWVTSSASGFPQTHATRLLQRTVGSDRVAFGRHRLDRNLGIATNANSAYQIHEVAGYDPMVPERIFDAWRSETGRAVGVFAVSTFQPAFKTLDEARVWGARWILEPEGVPGPAGARLAVRLGGQDLWKVPRSWQTSVAPFGTPVGSPRESGVRFRWRTPSDGTANITVHSASVVRIRILRVPGWSATIDGHPAPLRSFSGAMMQLVVQRGHHVLALTYLPTSFVVGLIVAGSSLLLLLAFVVVAHRAQTWERTRRNRSLR